jgi:lipopolysaccharide transport system ATP-binding protein
MIDTLIKVEGVSKKFCRSLKRSLWYGMQDLGNELRGHRHGGYGELREDEFWAVKDVSFELKRGECLGLIGRNGAGKTTLLRMLNGLIKPDSGSIEMRGRIGGLIALGAGFNPILTGRENIYINASVMGLSKKETDEKIEEIINFSEIGQFIDMPVQSYSSGMQVRLGFSVATALEPDILLLDEVLAVGDAKFRSKCIKRIGSILSSSAVIFVSHDAWSIRRICDTIIWLKQGSAIFQGDTASGMELYQADSQTSDSLSFFLNSSSCIKNLYHCVDAKEKKTTNGDIIVDLNINLAFDSEKSFALGFCLGNIITLDEIVVGQFDFKKNLREIVSGHNIITLQVSNIQLAKGEYSLAIVIFDAANKQMILNLRNFAKIQINGNLRYGPHYALFVD